MKRLRALNKFYRRYEVDLWGRIGFQAKNKTVRFLNKIQEEKIKFSVNPGRSFIVKKPYKNSLFKETEKKMNFSLKPEIHFMKTLQNREKKEKQNIKIHLEKKKLELRKKLKTEKLQLRKKLKRDRNKPSKQLIDSGLKFFGNNYRLQNSLTTLILLRKKRLESKYTVESQENINENNASFNAILKIRKERYEKKKAKLEARKHLKKRRKLLLNSNSNYKRHLISEDLKNKNEDQTLILNLSNEKEKEVFNYGQKPDREERKFLLENENDIKNNKNRVARIAISRQSRSLIKQQNKKEIINKTKYQNNLKNKVNYKSKNKFANSKFSNNKKKLNVRKVSKKPRQFVYRIDYADPQRKRAKTSLSRELFLVKTKLLRFYNNIKKDQIRRYANTKTFKLKFKAARGYTNRALLKYNSSNSLKKRLALNGFFSLVEHRLDVLLYRSNLVSTIQQARQLINHRHVFVNNSCVTHSGYILDNFDIVGLSKKMEMFMKKKLVSNIKKKRITFYPPKYIYVDYRLMRATLLSNPLVKQVPFPFKIDLRKWLGLAKYMF